MSLDIARLATPSRAPRSRKTAGVDRLPVSRETRRRWGKRPLPPVPALAAQLLDGDLGLITPAWAGWTLNHRSGELVAPNGDTWTVGRLQAWAYDRQLLEEYRRRLATPEQWRLI